MVASRNFKLKRTSGFASWILTQLLNFNPHPLLPVYLLRSDREFTSAVSPHVPTSSVFLPALLNLTLLTLICFVLSEYAIAKHPEAQSRIREEIALVRARATGEEFSIADLNSMVYTLATLKVVFGLAFCVPATYEEKCRSL
jgi:hypothetical protein